MELRTKIENKTLYLYPEGQIDSVSAPAFTRVIQENAEKADSIFIDMEKVSYVSSAGVRAVLYAVHRMENKNGVTVARACDYVKEVFLITGLETFLNLV